MPRPANARRHGRTVLVLSAIVALGGLVAPPANGSVVPSPVDLPTDRVKPGNRVPISLAADGELSQGSDKPSISADGKRVAFRSSNNDMVEGETITSWSTYVRDRDLAQNELLDRRWDGTPPEHRHSAVYPAISGNGRFVAFVSQAPDLVEGVTDRNRSYDAFLRDTTTGTTQLVSRNARGNAASSSIHPPGVSRNSRWVVFASSSDNLVEGDDNDTWDVFLFDRRDESTVALSRTPEGDVGNGYSFHPAISDDGRFVTYVSGATDLVGGDTNGEADILVHDRTTGTTSMITRGADDEPANGGSDEPAISGDGSIVVFVSTATNLADLGPDPGGDENAFAYDAATGTISLVSRGMDGSATGVYPVRPAADVSADGAVVAFVSDADDIVPGDEDDDEQIFLRNLTTGATTVVGQSRDGEFPAYGSTQPALSRNGRLVAFRVVDDVFLYRAVR